MHHCTTTIDSSFESLCLEDILKMAQIALESENQEFMTYNNFDGYFTDYVDDRFCLLKGKKCF